MRFMCPFTQDLPQFSFRRNNRCHGGLLQEFTYAEGSESAVLQLHTPQLPESFGLTVTKQHIEAH